MSAENPGHLKTLQSLRGLAALTVLVHHCLRLVADADNAWFVSEHFFNAHAAVVVFFVLSGYVLTLSLLRGSFSASSVWQFCAKRVFRIYPALWIGVALGTCYLLTLSNPPQTFFSDWANSLYQLPAANTSAIIGSLLGLRTELLPPLWTIKVELIASIILLPITAFLLNHYKSRFFPIVLLSPLVLTSFLLPNAATSLYLYQFVIGAICALHTHKEMYRAQISTPVFAASIACLIFFRQLSDWPYHHPLPSLVEACASAVLILGLTQGKAKNTLSLPPLIRLGDISYGIYILHLPIALFATSLTAPLLLESGVTPDATSVFIVLLVAAITLPAAALMYRWVELPCITLGRKTVNGISSIFSARTSHVE